MTSSSRSATEASANENGPGTGVTAARTFLSSASIYALMSVIQQSASFLLLPLYLQLFTTSEYGVLELVTVFANCALIIIVLGLPAAINKCYHRDCATPEVAQAILPTAVALVLPSTSVGCALLFLFASPVSVWLTGQPEHSQLLRIASGWIWLASVGALLLAFLRARDEARSYAFLTLTQFALLLALNLYFVAVRGWGVAGVLWGMFWSNVFLVAAACLVIRTSVRFALNRTLVRPLITFGLYVMPAALAMWAIEMCDRYLLLWLSSSASVGIYSVGYKLGRILSVLIVVPFQLAWPAFSFGISHQANHRAVYARTLTHLMAVMAFATLAVSLFSWPLLHILGEGRYLAAADVVPLVAIAYVFYGIHYCVAPGIHLAGKSKYYALLVVGAAVVNIALNLLLIPRWGSVGAALATIGAYLVLAGSTAALSAAVYPVRYEYGRITKIAVIATCCYVIGIGMRPNGLVAATAGSLVALGCLPLGLWLSRAFEADEIALVQRTVRGVLGPRVAS